MKGAASSASKSAKWRLNPVQVSVSIVGLVFLYTLLMWQMGWLQFLEFKSYDALIRNQPKAPTSDPIVLVEMTEADIHNPSLDWPIYDDRLAELFRILEAGKPAVIGLDIWRDMPVPKTNSVGIHELNTVLQTNANIVAIFTLSTHIRPPAILSSNADRIAFNDNFVVDDTVENTTPKVRRSDLFVNSPARGDYDAFPFHLATIYLDGKGIDAKPDPTDAKSILLGKARLRPLQPNDGAYIRADTGEFQILLDFKCPTNFTRYSFSDALSGKIRPESLRDKIVIMGMNTQSVFDERVTPISRNHRGMELQAMTVNQLLRMALDGEKSLRFWNRWQEDIWILFWCSIGGTIGFWIRSPGLLVLAAVGCLVGLGVTVWVAFMNGWWIPAVGPAVGFVPATTLVVAYISSHERAMRRLLMKLYAGHVSKEIAEATWEDRHSFMDGGRPLAQKQVVTVLFTDLKGFSTISEGMDPAHLFAWLNPYLGAMAEEIQNHGGVLSKFSGDGILALFGVPVPHKTRAEQSNDAIACVRCALAMGQRLVELDRGWKAEGQPTASMRAGIYTGEVATGSIGSDERFEYTVIGDIVNTAARLESYDKSLADPDLLPNRCRLLVGAPTYDLLDGKFLSKEIGLIEVKGKANKVPVFQILDEKPAVSADPSPPAFSAPRNDLALANDKQKAQITS
jgi:adenylate cyclase